MNAIAIVRQVAPALYLALFVEAVQPERVVSGEVAGNAVAATAREFLASAKGLVENRELQDAIHGSIDEKPCLRFARWEGVHGDDVFVVVAVPMPRRGGGASVGPASLKMVDVIAFNELLKTAVSVECFAKNGFEDREVPERVNDFETPAAQNYCRVVAEVFGFGGCSQAG